MHERLQISLEDECLMRLERLIRPLHPKIPVTIDPLRVDTTPAVVDAVGIHHEREMPNRPRARASAASSLKNHFTIPAMYHCDTPSPGC